MADAPRPNPQADDAEAPAPAAKSLGKWAAIARFLKRQWIVVLVIASLIVHGFGFAYYRLSRQAAKEPLSPEVGLGVFQFQADRTDPGRVSDARFSLHLALLDQIDAEARRRLHMHRQRVRQNVEQLLRNAHGEDFDDPNLAGLKRQVQEQVNASLDLRAVAEVIVTDLELRLRDQQVSPAADVAATTALPPPAPSH